LRYWGKRVDVANLLGTALSIAIARELGDKGFVVYPRIGLAHILCLQEDLDNARR
jgi:hypothetical protein